MKKFYAYRETGNLGENKHGSSVSDFKLSSSLLSKAQRRCLNTLLLFTLLIFGTSDINAQCSPVLETVSQATGGSTIVINTPAGTVPDDLLIAMVANNDGQPMTAPAGWTNIIQDGNGNDIQLAVFWKLAVAGEPASHTFNVGTNFQTAGAIVRYSGIDISNPINAFSQVVAINAPVCPSVTSTSNNNMVLRIAGLYADDSGFTIPPGTTEIVREQASGFLFNTSVIAAEETQAVAGATGTAAYSGPSEDNVAATVVIAANCPAGPFADYTIDAGGTINTCTGTFADSGDGGADYADGETQSMTFCSDIGNQISFTFEHFNTEAGADILTIYDGADNTATSLGSFSGFGVANSPGVVTASGPCLTFEFVSNGSVTAPGWFASITCTGSVPVSATAGSWTGYPEGSACPSGTDIGGMVYEDLNNDGILDTGEPPVFGVTVTLYDDNGQVGTPVTTDATGSYTFSGLTAGTVYRVEFLTPVGFEEGSQGPGDNTDVQFVDAGSCDVNFALIDPNQFCADPNPMWTIPCYTNGDPQHSSNINTTGVARFEYTDSGNSPSPTYSNYVTTGTVGSVWGNAYDFEENTHYYSAFLKRHVGIGPGGIGAIYMHVDGTPNTSAPIFYDFGAAAGTVASNATRFPGGGNGFGQEGPCGACDNIDPTTFAQIGKVGFGDLEVGPQGEYIYVTNLFDRKIYKISKDNPAPGSAIPLPGMPWLDNSPCNAGIARPWALEFRRGILYVGVICDASLSTCAIGAACSDLTVNVFAFDGATWTNKLTVPLDYYRDAYSSGSDYFVKWIDNWNTMAPFVSNVTDANFAQPVFMDIEFDDDHSMILGIGDRSGSQMGYQAPNPTAGSGDKSELNMAFGDILRAAYNNATDSYTIENNGSVGGLTSTNPTSNSGIGGKSFYWGDYWTGIGRDKWQGGVGSLALLPCSGEVMFPIGDAIDYYSNGVIWMSNTNGSTTRRIEVYQGSADGSASNFSKGSGLGDIELVVGRAPIEIGNIVWWDENANGLQDPSEPGIENVILELWKDNNGTFVKVAQTTTDAYGRYVFSNSTNSNGINAEDWSFTADNQVMPDMNYEVLIPSWLSDPGIVAYRNTLGYSAHLISPLENQGPTGIERDNNGEDDPSLVVNFAAANAIGDAVTDLGTGAYAQNDHSYDFAFYGEGGCEQPLIVPTATTPCHGEDITFGLSVTGGQTPYDYMWSGPNSFTSNIQNPTIVGADSTLNAGTYTITVTDALGCEETGAIDVVVNGISLSAVTTQTTCAGADGSIDLTIEDGQAPFTIDWDNDGVGDNDDTEDLSSLAGGTYKVTVTDADGCQAETVAIINENGAPTLAFTQVNDNCGAGAGSIDLTITGAFATIDWDNDGIGDNDDTEDLSGLSAGTYNVIVTNAAGCSSGVSVVIEDTPVPTASATPINTVCGNSDGEVDLLVSGGTAPYNYLWSNGATTEDITAVAASSYTVTITDANGCTATASSTITDTPGPTLVTAPKDEACSQSNGAVDLTVTGGTAPFTYAWNNGLMTEDIALVGEGTFDVTVTDANGCEATATQTVVNIPGPELSVVPTDATDCNTSDGAIDLTVTGGTGPYAYAWDTGATTEDISGLAAGPYQVTVTDANGCIEYLNTGIGNANDPVLDIVVTDPVNCGDTGDVDLTITGGTPPYLIDWDTDGIGDNDDPEDLTGLQGGTYGLIVTDAIGCSSQANVSIKIIRPPALDGVVTSPTCGNTDGAIDLVIGDPDAGPTPIYNFTWSNGATTEDLTGLSAGNYTVTVTNNINCEAELTFSLSDVGAADLVLIQNNPTCENSTDGDIDMTISAGTPPYTIDWSNDGIGDNDDTEDLAGLSAGTYDVTVTDSGNCQAVGSLTLEGSPPPELSGFVTNTDCGTPSGAIDLTISGIAPFTIDWDNDGVGDNDDTEDPIGLAAGTYNVTVVDANGCSTLQSFVVEAPDPKCFGISIQQN